MKKIGIMPKPKVLIAPSILSADFSCLKDEVKSVEKAGADWIHVDVMDGHFVPNLTIGPVVVQWLRKATSLFLDVHLMIENPSEYIPSFAEAGADLITFHYEACRNPRAIIEEIRKQGKKAGISLRPKTPALSIMPLLPYLDLALVMMVEPGFGGQKFMPAMTKKIGQLRRFTTEKNLKCAIEVDGGINRHTAPLAVQEGASILVAGNSVFGEKNRSAALKKIRASIDKIFPN